MILGVQNISIWLEKIVFNKVSFFLYKNKIGIIFFIFALLYISVILDIFYIGDDMINFNTGKALVVNQSYFTFYINSVVSVLLSVGRFFPTHILLSPLFIPLNYIMSMDILFYRMTVIVLILLNFFLFGYMVKKICGSAKHEYIAMLFVLLSLPLAVNYTHSPVYSFYGQMQFSLFFCLGMIVFYINYSESKLKKYLFLSSLFAMFLATHYEIGYTFIGLPFLISYIKRKNILLTLKECYIPTLVFIAFALLYFVMKKYVAEGGTYHYEGVAVSLNLVAILKTYFYQVTASLPLADVLANIFTQRTPYLYSPLSIVVHMNIKDFIIATLYLMLYIFFLKADKPFKTSKESFLLLLFIGLYLWLVPPMLVALSLKYQNELFWGIGYIPIYIQCYGVGIVFSCIAIKFAQKLYFYKNLILVTVMHITLFVIGLYIICSIQVNTPIAQHYIQQAHPSYTYELNQSAVRAGILDGIKNNSIIVTHSYFGYGPIDALHDIVNPNSTAISQILRRKVLSRININLLDDMDDIANRDVYLFESIIPYNDKPYGVALSSKVKHYPKDATTKDVDNIRIYISHTDANANANLNLIHELGKKGQVKLLKDNNYGQIYELHLDESDDFYSFFNEVNQYFLLECAVPLNLYEFYSFGKASKHILSTGLSIGEGTHRWSVGKQSKLYFRLTDDILLQNEILQLNLEGGLFNSDKQLIKVYLNDNYLGVIDKTTANPYFFNIPIKVFANKNILTLHIAYPTTPKELYNGGDTRELGISLRNMSLIPVGNYKNYDFTKELPLSSVINGVSVIEPWGRWSDGDVVTIEDDLVSDTSGGIDITIDGRLFNAAKQVVQVYMGEFLIATLNGATQFPYLISIPAEQIQNNKLRLKFKISYPMSPGAHDPRKLGIGFSKITVVPRLRSNQ